VKKLSSRFSNLVFYFDTDEANGGIRKDPFHLNYENGTYRQDELVAIIRDSLPHFGLTPKEFAKLKANDDIGEMYRTSMSRISKAKANKKGDYGELLLFLLLHFYYKAERFVTKVRLRSSRKDQIKGFDCAHFTTDSLGNISLWLGEVKFYKSFSAAVKDVCTEIADHIQFDYLKDEFSILCPNIEYNKNVDISESLEEVLDGTLPLNQVPIVIPALVTYETTAIKKFTQIDQIFRDKMKAHFSKQIKYIEDNSNLSLPANITVFFLLLPLEDVTAIKNKLEAFEEIYT